MESIHEVKAVAGQGVEGDRYFEGLTPQGLLAGLIYRGGLRAEIVTDGPIRVEDAITG